MRQYHTQEQSKNSTLIGLIVRSHKCPAWYIIAMSQYIYMPIPMKLGGIIDRVEGFICSNHCSCSFIYITTQALPPQFAHRHLSQLTQQTTICSKGFQGRYSLDIIICKISFQIILNNHDNHWALKLHWRAGWVLYWFRLHVTLINAKFIMCIIFIMLRCVCCRSRVKITDKKQDHDWERKNVSYKAV